MAARRLPPGELIGRAVPDRLVERAAMPAGARLFVRTDADALTVDLHLDLEPAADTGAADLVIDGHLAQRTPLTPGNNPLHARLPGRHCAVELGLPQWGRVRIGLIRLHGANLIEPGSAGSMRWITYGSSITQCATVAGPLDTWPARSAKARGWDLLCLGFNGEAHLDPIVAHTIAAEPASLISLCVGVNIHSQASYSARTLPGALAGFLGIIRIGHPETPIAVITPLFSSTRENWTNSADLTLTEVRDLVAALVTHLIKQTTVGYT